MTSRGKARSEEASRERKRERGSRKLLSGTATRTREAEDETATWTRDRGMWSFMLPNYGAGLQRWLVYRGEWSLKLVVYRGFIEAFGLCSSSLTLVSGTDFWSFSLWN